MVFSVFINLKIVIVLAVLFWRAPLQITQSAISLDSIEMSTFHTIGAAASESLQHKAMNPEGFVLTTNRCEVDAKITFGTWASLQLLPSALVNFPTTTSNPRAPDASIVSHSVAGEACYFSILNCSIHASIVAANKNSSNRVN